MVGRAFPADVDVLKVEVPEGATARTAWRATRLSRHRYYIPLKPQRAQLHEAGRVGYRRTVEGDGIEPDSDVGALLAGVVSVTPLSLDLTSRVALDDIDVLLKSGEG
jgi:5'-nucleotidase